jgi:two-component system invasion response regulator UvrY
MKQITNYKKILIIEDHDNLRSTLHSWLIELFPGTEIYEAATGEDGLSIALSVNPDIAIVDICLPGIDGIEVTKRLKKAKLKTNVIILTILNESSYQNESYKSGANAFIYKKDVSLMLPNTIQSFLNLNND